MDQSFSQASIEALRPNITGITDHYPDQLDTNKPVDITEDFARPLPLDVISVLIGIKPDLRTILARAIAPISKPTGILTILTALPDLYKTQKLSRAEITHIRDTPHDGLLSTLIHDPTCNLTDDEILSLAFIFSSRAIRRLYI